jgi:hypothetical protein
MEPFRDFKGACLGVRVHDHDPTLASHRLIELLVEDDGHWFVKKASGFDSAFIDDLIMQLEAAQRFIQKGGRHA